MSAKFLQSDTPSEISTIKVNDIKCRGHLVVSEYVRAASLGASGPLTFTANADIKLSGKITLPAMTGYSQLTSETTSVSITGAEQQFTVETFDGSIAAGASASFQVFNASCFAGKTLVLCSNDVSDNTLLTVNSFVAYGTTGAFIVTRHNFGSVAAAGKQTIVFKLIQSA